jgi:ATP-dependent Lhr-like helicase
MSILAGLGEATPALLASRVLGMTPFQAIDQEDFREFLHNLITMEHIEQTEEGGLIVGLKGEKIIGNFKFFAVFPEEDEYTVTCDSKTIGKIEIPPPPGERITLAGRTWEVTDVDMKRKSVYAIPVKGKIRTYWAGGSLKIHNRIPGKMKNILDTELEYPYLQTGAKARMAEAYFLARNTGFDRHNVLTLGGKTVCVFPWMGSIDYHLLTLLIKKLCGARINLKSVGGQPPFFILVKLAEGPDDAADFLAELKNALNREIDLDDLLNDDDVLELKRLFEYKTPKFDEFIPMHLLKKALIADYIDLEAVREEVAGWTCGEA